MIQSGIYNDRYYQINTDTIYKINSKKDIINKAGIYMISGNFKEISDEKVCYIGSSVSLKKRIFNCHVFAINNSGQESLSNLLLVNSCRKHGIENFSFFILENTDIKNTFIREQQWIDFYSAKFGFNCLFNINEKVDQVTMTEENKIKQSIRLKESKQFSGQNNPMYNSQRFGEKNPFFNKKHSEETRRKMSFKAKERCKNGKNHKIVMTDDIKNKLREIRTGTKQPQSVKDKLSKFFKGRPNKKCWKAVVQINAETNEVIKRWNSIQEASNKLKINGSSICKCCMHKIIKGREVKIAGGFKWEYSK